MTHRYLVGNPHRCLCENSLNSLTNLSQYTLIASVKFDESNPEEKFDESAFYQNMGRQALIGEIGCALAHQEVYSSILKDTDEWSMVFEDDFHYSGADRFNERYSRLNLLSFDTPTIIVFYTDDEVVRKSFSTDIQTFLKSPIPPSNTLAYMINRAAAKILVEKNGVVKFVADWPASIREIDYYLAFDYDIQHGCEKTKSTILSSNQPRPTPQAFIRIQMWTGVWFLRHRSNWQNFSTYFVDIIQPRLRYKIAKIGLTLLGLFSLKRRN
jgi:hypothetical protein